MKIFVFAVCALSHSENLSAEKHCVGYLISLNKMYRINLYARTPSLHIFLAGDPVAWNNCFSSSLHLMNFFQIPSTSVTQKALVCLPAFLCWGHWCHLWGHDFFYMITTVALALLLYYTCLRTVVFSTSISGYRCCRQSAYGLEVTHAVKRKCTKENW